jgi:hypothetical protein
LLLLVADIWSDSWEEFPAVDHFWISQLGRRSEEYALQR